MMSKINLKKETILLIATICLLIICYELAFKKTVVAWQLNRHLNQQVSNFNLAAQPQYLQRQNEILNKVTATFKADTLNYRNQIINQIANIGDQNKVKVVEVPIQNDVGSGKFLVQKIQLKGDFKSLLTTLNHLEKLKQLGYIRSVVFKKSKANNTSTPDPEQLMDLYVEIIK